MCGACVAMTGALGSKIMFNKVSDQLNRDPIIRQRSQIRGACGSNPVNFGYELISPNQMIDKFFHRASYKGKQENLIPLMIADKGSRAAIQTVFCTLGFGHLASNGFTIFHMAWRRDHPRVFVVYRRADVIFC